MIKGKYKYNMKSLKSKWFKDQFISFPGIKKLLDASGSIAKLQQTFGAFWAQGQNDAEITIFTRQPNNKTATLTIQKTLIDGVRDLESQKKNFFPRAADKKFVLTRRDQMAFFLSFFFCLANHSYLFFWDFRHK